MSVSSWRCGLLFMTELNYPQNVTGVRLDFSAHNMQNVEPLQTHDYLMKGECPLSRDFRMSNKGGASRLDWHCNKASMQ